MKKQQQQAEKAIFQPQGKCDEIKIWCLIIIKKIAVNSVEERVIFGHWRKMILDFRDINTKHIV